MVINPLCFSMHTRQNHFGRLEAIDIHVVVVKLIVEIFLSSKVSEVDDMLDKGTKTGCF